MAFYQCKRILRNGEICNRGSYQEGECKLHYQSSEQKPCKECGKMTTSDLGYCAPHGKKHRARADYHTKRLAKIAEKEAKE